jgi:hypothetical protein
LLGKLIHPRFLHFPWQKDYAAQPNVFCPYVMSLADSNYRSDSVNIDRFGFRRQFDAEACEIDLGTARQKYSGCSLLLGNSTSFGVSVSADRKTLGHYFSLPDRPCINLSTRAATMHQELAAFQTFKHLLPPVKEIYLFTGICDVSVATQPEDFYSDAVGALNSANTYYNVYLEKVRDNSTVEDLARKAFLGWAENWYQRSAWVQNFWERRILRKSAPVIFPSLRDSFDRNFRVLLALTSNVLETWGWIQAATGARVNVVLQPVMGWTTKAATSIEQACLDADLARIPAIPLYANRAVYKEVASHFKKACVTHGIHFLDANQFFDSLALENGTLFSDICHLTDHGTKIAAEWMLSAVRSK